MKYIYDARTNAFYPVVLKDDYVSAGIWPEGGVEIDEKTFADFQDSPAGMARIAGANGYPTWGILPPPTYSELVAIANTKKSSFINEANNFINMRQWPGKAAMGRLSDKEKAQYNRWLDYLDALEAVDIALAPDIRWPEPPKD